MVAVVERELGVQSRYHRLLERIDLRKLYTFAAAQSCVKVPCPWHRDGARPNLAVYPSNVYCFACGAHHGAIAYLKHYLGYDPLSPDTPQVVLALAESLCSPDVFEETPAGYLPLADTVVEAYERSLLRRPDKLEWIGHKYGLTQDTIKAARLGHTNAAYAIPIVGMDGVLYNVKFRTDYAEWGNAPFKYFGVQGHGAYPWYFTPALWGSCPPDGSSGDHGAGGEADNGGAGGAPALARNVQGRYGRAAVCLTEGEFDALALFQLGIPAVSGTHGRGSFLSKSSREHLSVLRGLSVYVMYDQDEAGQSAAEQIIGVLADLEIPAYNVTWDSYAGKDPSEIVVNGWGPSDLRELFRSCRGV